MFNLKDIRVAHDRYNLLARKYKKKEREEINASGIGTDEPSELDDAIEEAVALFENLEEERENKKTAKDEDRSQAEDARLVALETARETAKRKAPLGNDSFRAKSVEFLRDKANQEIEYRNKELDHKTKELEVRKQELEIRNKELEAQSQQNQNLLNTLLEFAKNR